MFLVQAPSLDALAASERDARARGFGRRVSGRRARRGGGVWRAGAARGGAAASGLGRRAEQRQSGRQHSTSALRAPDAYR